MLWDQKKNKILEIGWRRQARLEILGNCDQDVKRSVKSDKSSGKIC
jgi:hypothetical protein